MTLRPAGALFFAEWPSIIDPLFYRISCCLMSPHFQVSKPCPAPCMHPESPHAPPQPAMSTEMAVRLCDTHMREQSSGGKQCS